LCRPAGSFDEPNPAGVCQDARGQASKVKAVSQSSSNAPLTTPSAAGLFVSYHPAVQKPSVFDCQGLAKRCSAGSARSSQAKVSVQGVWIKSFQK